MSMQDKVRGFAEEFYSGNIDALCDQHKFIADTVKRMPKYSAIDPMSAGELAMLALSASYVCAEMISIVAREAGILDVMVKAEETAAYYRSKSSAAGMKKIDSQSDEEYVKIQKKSASAKAFLDFLRRENQVLMATHYLCKEILKSFTGSVSPDAMSQEVSDLI